MSHKGRVKMGDLSFFSCKLCQLMKDNVHPESINIYSMYKQHGKCHIYLDLNRYSCGYKYGCAVTQLSDIIFRKAWQAALNNVNDLLEK